MDRVFGASVAQRAFVLHSGKTKDNKIGIWFFSVKYAAL